MVVSAELEVGMGDAEDMASKAFSLFLFTVLLPLLSHGTSRDTNNKKSSPFDFLKHLEGCHKGDNVSGIKFLKSYLEQFGYLNHSHSVMQNHANDDDFDEPLESALKTYQLNFHLNTTGTLDAKTVSNMMMPRCGVADIINGTNWMRTDNKNHDNNHGSFHTISHYAFFPRNP
ncbi:hypothetical protein SO802_026748 [Lithocarpus litseifolius]|uniref:Peptidoglycan binding-like domain-containing protein n=1 Tax=Lithocarpus litseifolius TaxID=425828 RepID=A0AAW2C1C2_9ROSI